MKQELITPQYGFAVRHFAEDSQDSSEIAQLTSNVVAYSGASTFWRATGPTVVVKTIKRRLLKVDTAGNGVRDVPAGAPLPEGAADGRKVPKVFLLAHPRQTAALEGSQQTEPMATAEGDVTESVDVTSIAAPISSPVPTRRRRRNLVTAPVLVRHIVFETPEAERGPQTDELAIPAWNDVNYKAVCQALQELRKKVDAVVRVRDLLAEFDLPQSKM